MSLKFRRTFTFSSTDQEWEFTVANLPKEQPGLIKVLTVTSTTDKQEIEFRYDHAPHNRVVDPMQLSRYMVISFTNFRLFFPADPAAGRMEIEPAPLKDTGDFITRILRAGIRFNNATYHFLGHSSSQLRNKTCFLYADSKQSISHKIESLGDFSKIKTVAKKVKRIGLLFTSGEASVQLDPKRCQDIADIQTKDFIFTDGCGFISVELGRQIARQKRIVFRNTRYLPSVFQIRYRGYKGVLMLEPGMPKGILAQFRDSMRKFSTNGDDNSLAAVDYSKPYGFGFLNDELVTLMSALGISNEVFLEKQQEHFDFLTSALTDPVQAFRLFASNNRLKEAESIIYDGLEPVQSSIKSMISKEFERMIGKREQQRCRIMVRQSRVLFGVCDPRDILKPGECFVRVTSTETGQPMTIAGKEILLGRNPCLHPGDVRKFRAVNRPELNHLVDCIVFPTKGKRPSADLMSGGDLDGDKFFVCWDSKLIPTSIAEPAEYPGGREPVQFKKITDDDRLEFFARYTNASLGKVKNLYLEWVRVKGAMSPECQELNRLFSLCVDGNRIRVPATLQATPVPTAATPPFVLDILHDAAKKYIEQHRSLTRKQLSTDLTLEGLEILLSQDDLAMSEMEIIQMTYRWCRANHARLMDFIHFFNFNALSADEKRWFLKQLPIDAEAPSLVLNGLLQSSLLSPDELAGHKLHYPAMRWKAVFSSAQNNMRLFLDVLGRTLPLFHKTLIVVRVDERLTIAIYIPRKGEACTEIIIDDSTRLFAFSHTSDGSNRHRLAVPTKKNYRLYFDHSTFQLYESQRGNTWVFLNKSELNKAPYQNVKGKGDRRRGKQATIDDGINFDWRASVALDKFSSGLQRHVGRVNRNGILGAEVYVISNRDVNAQEVMDLWIQQIDTEIVLPNFERKAKEFEIPPLSGIDWTVHSEVARQIITKKEFMLFKTFKTKTRFEEVFRILLECDEKGLLHDIFHYLLQYHAYAPPSEQIGYNAEEIFYTMLGTAESAPNLVIAFTAGYEYTSASGEFKQLLFENAPTFIEHLILASNSMKELTYAPLQACLEACRNFSMSYFCKLVQTICLTVQSPEIALDFLLEILEKHTSRLLSGSMEEKAHLVRLLYGIAMDHIDEARENKTTAKYFLELRFSDEPGLVHAKIRLDTPLSDQPRFGDHVRLTVASHPTNAGFKYKHSMAATVEKCFDGTAVFRCLHPQPSYLEECSWKLTNYGSFTTTRTMFTALETFVTERNSACGIHDILLGITSQLPSVPGALDTREQKYDKDPSLNDSQNKAIEAAMNARLTALWGPPGTGKTHTIVQILLNLVERFPNDRILVTAPTHNAVDNVMQKFLSVIAALNRKKSQEASNNEDGDHNLMARLQPLRVSTDVRKVSDRLKSHTVDAQLGKDLSHNPKLRKQAQERVSASRMIFTTCIGSGLGLLAKETFETVIIDEASQQTEPSSLVPLVKGAAKAILVGDHVQLRASVGKHASTQGMEVSLFERLYTSTKVQHAADSRSFRKVMLDTQYRMHSSLCEFPSSQFYEGKLRTGKAESDGKPSPLMLLFDDKSRSNCRKVFIQCSEKEDSFHKSKQNSTQAQLCINICKSLLTAKSPDAAPSKPPSIVILSPYSRQTELLTQLISSSTILKPAGVSVSTIDGFQGREADIIIFGTVRCNEFGEIGFLKDMRRLNVALTRAREALIVVGDRTTLIGSGMVKEEEEGEKRVRDIWKGFINDLTTVQIDELRSI